ncbi:YkgJ family cysteine cluster protein [Xanthocytophaga agilis]|uniref:YkgJ family cysteine cluster protein n=1 Tax=Xanthocytophaga agilis TaxID=3048010 RepID=A0AAE3QXK4_9BACT|nr:YkgJ family cysteine cluster protein [Xanthocytophaga agilis]MDJ1499881.1 YkgJ family cysteine cluster protein [Xanthocytophaga agilis]
MNNNLESETIKKLKLQAKKSEQDTKKLFQKWKKQPPRNLDIVIQEIHEEVFEVTDCLQCANCCKTTSPIFYDRDIDRIAKFLKVKPKQFIDTYLHIDEDGDYVLNLAPCSFLNEDNTCSIYHHRPAACREYPHTDRKRFHQILDLTLKNTFICPAAYQIVEKLKTALS